VGTILLGIAGIVASMMFKLNVKSHKVLVDEVERLKQGGSMRDASSESREVFEKLTGFKYEQCWGNNNVGYKDKQPIL
jgi:oligogalacturonide transporter